MEIVWQDLPERLNVWTVRNTVLEDMHTGKIKQHYSTNTHLAVVQKTIWKGHTWYRTVSSVERGLDWAFRASSFGLSDEKPAEEAPSVPSKTPSQKNSTPKKMTSKSATKQKTTRKKTPPKDGEVGSKQDSTTPRTGWFSKIFRRGKWLGKK